jgi:uncharacterized membrane protein YhhN
MPSATLDRPMRSSPDLGTAERAPVAGAAFAVIAAATLVVYALVALGVTPRGSPLIWATKPFVMPALLLWLARRIGTEPRAEIRVRAVYAALVFAALGDAFLIPGHAPWGPLGVVAFGLAHVSYLVAFFRREHLAALRAPEVSFALVALLTFVGVVRTVVSPAVSQAPALLDGYMLLLVAMVATTLCRLGARRDRASASILVGAVIFMESDSLIALGAAKVVLPLHAFAIMATYIAGQFLIARGVAAAPKSA